MIDTSYTLEKLKLDKKKLKLDWQHTTNIRRAVKNFKVNYTDWLELSTRHFQTSNSLQRIETIQLMFTGLWTMLEKFKYLVEETCYSETKNSDKNILKKIVLITL